MKPKLEDNHEMLSFEHLTESQIADASHIFFSDELDRFNDLYDEHIYGYDEYPED